jgi:hypothetical protein
MTCMCANPECMARGCLRLRRDLAKPDPVTTPVPSGWRCPSCGAGVAPGVDVCPVCRPALSPGEPGEVTCAVREQP